MGRRGQCIGRWGVSTVKTLKSEKGGGTCPPPPPAAPIVAPPLLENEGGTRREKTGAKQTKGDETIYISYTYSLYQGHSNHTSRREGLAGELEIVTLSM